MMRSNLSLLVAAAALGIAWATPCTDICFGTCDMTADTSSILLPFFDAFVQPNQDACRTMCTATCNCVDTCTGRCAALMAACRGADTSFFKFLQCQIEFIMCDTFCSTQCTLAIGANVLNRAYNILLPDDGQTAT